MLASHSYLIATGSPERFLGITMIALKLKSVSCTDLLLLFALSFSTYLSVLFLLVPDNKPPIQRNTTHLIVGERSFARRI